MSSTRAFEADSLSETNYLSGVISTRNHQGVNTAPRHGRGAFRELVRQEQVPRPCALSNRRQLCLNELSRAGEVRRFRVTAWRIQSRENLRLNLTALQRVGIWNLGVKHHH